MTAIMSQVICAGSHQPRMREISDRIASSFSTALKWFSGILFETIPSFLGNKLADISSKGLPQKKLLRYNPKPEAGAYRVYDLVNCGPMNRFMVGNLIAHNCGYGAGVNRLRTQLIMNGFPVTVQEAKIIHRDYWTLYAGIKKFQKKLEMIWADNGGWIPNVLGRPICVAEKYLHDIVNRFAQSSGHDVLQLYLYHTERLRRERQVEMYPWIPDLHDEQIWESPDAHVEAAAQVMRDALAATNAELGMEIQIKADVMICNNLAEIKCDD